MGQMGQVWRGDTWATITGVGRGREGQFEAAREEMEGARDKEKEEMKRKERKQEVGGKGRWWRRDEEEERKYGRVS